MAASSMTGPFCWGAAWGLLLRLKKWYTLSWGASRCRLPVYCTSHASRQTHLEP